MLSPRLLCAAPVLLVVPSIALSWLSPPLWAQPTGPAQPVGRSATAPDALRQLAERLSRRWNVTVLVDPALARRSLEETPADDLQVEPSLDLALGSMRRVAWRRVHLPPGQGEAPSVEALAAAARALEQREMGSMVIEDPTGERLTAYLKEEPVASASEEGSERLAHSAPPLYLVYSTTPPWGGAPSAHRFADLQRQQLELPIGPENRAAAMVQMMRRLQELPPADMEAYASRTLQAGMPLWESTPPALRQEMIQQTLQMMKAFDAALQRAAAPGAATRRPLPVQRDRRRGNSMALAAALSERSKATVVIDPALFLERLPELPPPDAPVEEVFTAVTRALPGSAWRRVYLTEVQLKHLPAAEKLAAWVRTLEQMEPGSLTLRNGATRRGITLRKAEPLASRTRLLKQGGLSDEPVYLLISTTPSARGGTPEERLSDLQRQQIGLMLRMSPEQMGQSMGQVIRSFPSADPELRARLLGLPTMAGLMAVWMPREAKESGQPLVP